MHSPHFGIIKSVLECYARCCTLIIVYATIICFCSLCLALWFMQVYAARACYLSKDLVNVVQTYGCGQQVQHRRVNHNQPANTHVVFRVNYDNFSRAGFEPVTPGTVLYILSNLSLCLQSPYFVKDVLPVFFAILPKYLVILLKLSQISSLVYQLL